MNDKWYDNLRGRMEAHREAPPEGLWDDIERAMDRAAAFRSRRRRILYWGGGAAAAAAAVTALFFIAAGGQFQDNTVEPLLPAVASEYPRTTQEPEISAPGAYAADVPAAPAQSRSAAVTGTRKSLPSIAAAISDDKAPQERPGEYTPVGERDRAAEAVPSEERDPKSGNPPREEKSSSPANLRPADNFDTVLASGTPKSKRGRWQAGLYASNLASTGSSAAAIQTKEAAVYDDMAGYTSIYNTVGQEIGFSVASREPLYTDTSHSLPVTVGVSVGYGLGERWSLASGLNWTMLTSRSRNARGAVDDSRKQVLHYIGIPLDVKYNIWSGSALSLYLSAGGQVEKSVSGTETHSRAANAGETRSISDRVQWSIRGSAGLQYDITGTTGIYVEPGVNYYFDNGSAIETVYKAKPFNFGLRLGLRFSLWEK